MSLKRRRPSKAKAKKGESPKPETEARRPEAEAEKREPGHEPQQVVAEVREVTMRNPSTRANPSVQWLGSHSVSSTNTFPATASLMIPNTALLNPNVMIVQISSGTACLQSISDNPANTWVRIAGPYEVSGISQVWWIAQGATLNLTTGNHTFNVTAPCAAAPSMTVALLYSDTVPIPIVDYATQVRPGQFPATGAGPVSGGAITLAGVAVAEPNRILSIDSLFTLAEQRMGVSGQCFGIGLAYRIAPGRTDPIWTANTAMTSVLTNLSFGSAPEIVSPGGMTGVGTMLSVTMEPVVGASVVAHRPRR